MIKTDYIVMKNTIKDSDADLEIKIRYYGSTSKNYKNMLSLDIPDDIITLEDFQKVIESLCQAEHAIRKMIDQSQE